MRFQKLLLPLLFFFSWHSLLAQSTNGKISGLVVDPTGGVIAGADLLVIDDVTGVKTSSTTNSDGIYVFPNLQPGPYRLQVSKPGFKTLIKPDIVLNVQGALSINFTLPVGAVSDSVTVEGGASMVNTVDASVSTIVDQSYVANMPLNGRSFQDLILLAPGTVTQSPQPNSSQGLGSTGEFSVNGQRTESNYYTVDGVSANVGVTSGSSMVTGAGASGSLAASTALGTTQALVSVDALQEFRVQTSTYSAEYGRNPGGQFAFQTKSGTNQFHGTAFDYLRNGALDARDWFTDYFGVSQPALRQNDFGGTVGGPAEIPGLYDGRDKTFFFFSYEGLRLTQPQPGEADFVPDLCLRGVASSCTGSNTPAPAALLPIMNAFPLPSASGIDDTVNGFAQFIGSWSDRSSLDSTSVRFDQTVSDRVKLFFRFGDNSSNSTNRPALRRGVDSNNEFLSRTYTAGADAILSNRLTNQLRFNYTSNESTSASFVDSFGGNTPVNLLQLSGLSPADGVFVGFIYGGYNVLDFQSSPAGSIHQWNVVDSIDLAYGHHQFTFGTDYRRLASFSNTPPSASYLFLSKNQLMANSSSFSDVNQAPAYPLFTNFSAFLQDRWKISQRLNLSMGVRWDVNPAPTSTQGLNPYTISFLGSSPTTWTLAPQGTSLWRTTWYNLAPRLGVAYLLRDAPGKETVFRTGAGVFFDTGQQLGADGYIGPGFSSLKVCSSCPFPGAPLPFPALVNPPLSPYSNMRGYAPHLQLPYTLSWNASIEQELGKTQALSLSYVGSHASRLLEQSFFPPTGNPNTVTTMIVVQNGLTSDYDSLQVQFRRTLSRGLTALGSYTWSHCLDYGSENYVPSLGANSVLLGYQHGNCDFDVRNNLSTAFSYDLPGIGQNRFVSALVHHWGLDDRIAARTAFPVNLYGKTLIDSTTGREYNAGLNFVPGEPIYLYGANCDSILQQLHDLSSGETCPGGRAINPLAFTNVVSGLGNVPRNFARGFGSWQMNLAARREFPIHDEVVLQFRAEAFNILNHPSFGTINPNFGQATFGQATATLANSLSVLNALYQTGGARSMQISLKLTF